MHGKAANLIGQVDGVERAVCLEFRGRVVEGEATGFQLGFGRRDCLLDTSQIKTILVGAVLKAPQQNFHEIGQNS